METMDDALLDHVIGAANSMIDAPTIYKYFDLDTGLKALQNKSIAFSRPDRFNDPFDCSVELLNIDPVSTREHMAGAIVRRLGNNYSERFRLKRQLDKASDQYVEALAKRGLRSEYSHRGISCFSTTFQEILMWAHYCKNHNGICIGYDTVMLYEYLRTRVEEIGYLPMDYVPKLDKKNLYPVSDHAIFYMLKTKSDIWAYEREVRITGTNFIFNDALLNLVKLDDNLITHVFIGINVHKDNFDQVLVAARSLRSDMPVFKMMADYTAFNLVSKPV